MYVCMCMYVCIHIYFKGLTCSIWKFPGSNWRAAAAANTRSELYL